MSKRAIVWFRNDLRLHDHEALSEALRTADEIIPIYVFDERVWNGHTHFGFRKQGVFRAQFMLESVEELRNSLRALGSELYIRIGKPEVLLPELVESLNASWIFCTQEYTQEEVDVQNALEKSIWRVGQELRFGRGKTMFNTADLPFPVQHTPDVFTHFRKEVERHVQVRMPLPTPAKAFKPVSASLDPGNLPVLEDFGFSTPVVDSRAVIRFKGGEKQALDRLRYYLWETNLIKTYKETRNELLGGDYSSKFSPWLAAGCLSPKQVYHEIKQYEAARGGNESTYWLFFELMWRDFFHLMARKHGNRIFGMQGPKGKADARWKNDFNKLTNWINGSTSAPFINANMLELKHTGFMSNRGRQNVACYLAKDLFVNWQMGAEYFESMLVDYDPCSNWCNWNYVAGVGSDPREDRYFNTKTQSQRYDPEGKYVRAWFHPTSVKAGS